MPDQFVSECPTNSRSFALFFLLQDSSGQSQSRRPRFRGVSVVMHSDYISNPRSVRALGARVSVSWHVSVGTYMCSCVLPVQMFTDKYEAHMLFATQFCKPFQQVCAPCQDIKKMMDDLMPGEKKSVRTFLEVYVGIPN